MKSGLKKSLYFGLAAVSVLAASSLATTTASAKTYAKVTSNKTMTTAPETRNVTTNGTNALYTKAGTLRGARVVASKSTMAALGNSNKSQNYFRAYQVATTNRGSVYYKIVSFDGKYRGWIYGGKSTTAFGGGINAANTMTSADKPATTSGYTLVDATKNTLWVNPSYSQYKAQKADMSGYTAGDTFTVTDAATKTREGWLYYKVVDDKNANVTGWVYADGLKSTENSITVNYVDLSTNKSVGTLNMPFSTYATSATASSANLTTGTAFSAILKAIPTGYAASNTDNNSSASFASLSSATTAPAGSTVTFYVKSSTAATTGKTSTITINLHTTDGKILTTQLLPADQTKLQTVASEAKYQVASGATVSAATIKAILTEAGLTSFTVNGQKYELATTGTADATATTGNNPTVSTTALYNAVN